MNLNFKFRHMRRSEEKVEYVSLKLEKLAKFEWRPLTAHVTFTAERNQCAVEIRLTGQGVSYKAQVTDDDFTAAVDAVIAKLQRQLQKKKARVQEHLVFENTHLGKLNRNLPKAS